jgi:hypothetical protein
MNNTPSKYVEPRAGLPVPMDMTEILHYQSMIAELTNVNNINGPLYMREFLKAKELATSFYCRLLFDYEQSKKTRKEAEAIAYLEKSVDYLKARNIKETDAAKNAYVQIDDAAKGAKDVEDMLKALLTMFEHKIASFQAAHDDAKKIYDSTKDPRGGLPSIPSGRDSQ